jgi:hypothetical protein
MRDCNWLKVHGLSFSPFVVLNHNNTWDHCWLFAGCCGAVDGNSFDATTNTEVHKLDVIRAGHEDILRVDNVCNAQMREITAVTLVMWTVISQSKTSQLASSSER